MIKVHCTKCGKVHEVKKSHKNAYMFCLECDKFFKVEKKYKSSKKNIEGNLQAEITKTESLKDDIVGSLLDKIRIHKEKIKDSLKGFAEEFNRKREKMPEPVEEDIPERVVEKLQPQPQAHQLIDNFLNPGGDLLDGSDGMSAEYMDFMSAGVNAVSDDVLQKSKSKDKKS